MSALPVPSTAITPEDVEALSGLTHPKWQRFVAAYCSGSTMSAAVQSAGYTAKAPKQLASRLLKQPVAAAVVVMSQLREDREFAIRTENAAAAVRASELMARMSGHLVVDRIDPLPSDVSSHFHVKCSQKLEL